MSEQKKRTELQVAAIENGSVLDHIPSEHLFKVAQLLGLEHMDHRITIGNNLKSSKMGHKGVIKIADKFFEEDEINRIAVVAPNVVLNTIRDYEVVEKRRNPKCITNNEPMKSRFYVTDKECGTVQCRYCEHKIHRDEIVLK